MPPRTNHALVVTLNPRRAAFYRGLLRDDFALDVHVARDGEEAQQLAARHGCPLLLITDISLLKVDGVTLIRHLRRDAPKDRMGVIVVSAHEQLRTTARQYVETLGISRILAADVERAAVCDAIQAALPPLSAAPAGSSLHKPVAEPSGAAAGERAEDALDLATLEATRRFRVPLSVAYFRVDSREHVAAHLSGSDSANTSIEPPEIGMLRQIASAGEPLVLPDLDTHPLGRELGGLKRTILRGFAGIPLTFDRADVSGTICLLDTRPLALDADDLDALTRFAYDLGRVIERRLEVPAPTPTRAELTPEAFEALERMAVTDPLTGLSNRRGGEQNIASELARAKRQRAALSCILLDIDRFKEVNDTYGHQAGDHVLREISALLRRTVRAYDILVRWGGEEFLIVLPGVDLDQARKLADRVRRAVEVLETNGVGPVTISAGAATLDPEYDFEAMLAQADRRLFQAKAAGRNCIV